jgi:hypothetical protein
MSTVAERVARGAELLDEKVPGWAERISVAELDLSSCSSCVIGQLFATEAFNGAGLWPSGYDFGVQIIGVNGWESWYGFDRRFSDTEPWSELNDEWRRVIAERTARVPAGAAA